MKALVVTFLASLFWGLWIDVSAQIINVPNRIENKVVNRVNRKIDRGIDKGLDAIEDSLTINNKKTTTPATQKNDPKQTGTTTTAAGSKGEVKQDQQAMQTYSKYDFIPGEKVIFYEDFSQDAIGDFPALWNTNGSAEVVTTNLYPGNWMKFITRESIWTDALLKLPDNYTIEFDVIPIPGVEKRMAGYNVLLIQSKSVKSFDYGSAPGEGGFAFKIEYYGTPRYATWLNKQGCAELKVSGSKDDESLKQKENLKYHIAIWVQKSRIRLYQDQTKMFDLPKAMPVECLKIDRIRFEEGAAMVSNIRVAVGAPDMRNKLMTEGKLVTYGIYFDVNKDVVKPESYGTLKEIAAILNEVPDVKVKIVGHTDSDGADAANLDLSKRRAASVKAELVKSFNVKGDRLVTDGMGESQPVAPNDTPVNKALNRRVEFIKM
jgi:OOP family OmpA-OmpF porin